MTVGRCLNDLLDMLGSSLACVFAVRSSSEQCSGSSVGPVNVQHIRGSWKMAASEVELVAHAIQLLQLCEDRRPWCEAKQNAQSQASLFQEEAGTASSELLVRLSIQECLFNRSRGAWNAFAAGMEGALSSGL